MDIDTERMVTTVSGKRVPVNKTLGGYTANAKIPLSMRLVAYTCPIIVGIWMLYYMHH